MNAIERLITSLPRNLKVLDVGCAGLGGENTTNYLYKHFTDITGICTTPEETYKEIKLIKDDFYTHDFKEKYDLVVLDLDLELSLKDWSDNMQFPLRLLRPGGYLLTFLMTTDQYGDPDRTPKLIKEQWVSYWGAWPPNFEDIGNKLLNLPNYQLIAHRQEERRPYITWILLKTTQESGLSQ